MRLTPVLISLLAACVDPGSTQTLAQTTQAIEVNSRGCYDPADLGAIPDDQVDDRPAFQAAIDAASVSGGLVCVGAGRWTLTRAPIGARNRFASIAIKSCNVTLRGVSRSSTILEMLGDQGGATTYMISLDPGACKVEIADLALDTSATFNTDEQYHAIEIGSGVCSTLDGTCSKPVEDISIERVRFSHPRSPVVGERKGDCIRLLGNTAATQVRRVKINNGEFLDCARSSVAIQRNVNSLVIMGNNFAAPYVDQQIDGEATGGEWDEGIEIIGNTFDDQPSAQGDHAVALTSYKKAIISNNIFRGRGLVLYRTNDVIVSGNIFDALTEDPNNGVIWAHNQTDGLKISGNNIRRSGAIGHAIKLNPHSGHSPSEITISDNTIALNVDGSGIYAEAAQDITISNNSVRFNVAAPNSAAFFLRNTTRVGDGIMITGNRITAHSPIFTAIRLSASPYSFEGVTISGNTQRGPNPSLRCDQSTGGTYLQPVIHVGNRWTTTPNCIFPELRMAYP